MKPALCVALALVVLALCLLSEVGEGAARAAGYLGRLWPPELGYLPKLAPSVLHTLKMSAIGTTLALVSAVPLSYFGCKNLVGNTALYVSARFLLSVLRATPVLVLGIVFVAALGLGPTAGVLGIWFHSMGALGKLMSESLDAADRAIQEAAALDGATRWQTFLYVLVPMHVNAFLSYYLHYIEANFRAGVVLGVVGAGGVGIELITAVGLYRYKRTGLVVLSIIFTSLLLDFISRNVRKKLLDGS